MLENQRERLRQIRTFPSLVKYLRDELDWPIESDDFEELTFDYTPEELGIDLKSAAKIQDIKRLRPLSASQPWGIFFVKFEPKRLPVVALRRILGRVVVKKRASANSAERAAWSAEDLLFVSNYGEGEERQISFAHFSQDTAKSDLPTLKVLGWDNLDTALHLDHVADELQTKLTWPEDDQDLDTWRITWRSAFTQRHREVITTSKALAVRLAELARNIRARISTVLDIETEDGPLTKLMTAFQEALIHDLDEDAFADMYAQTIAYGLLSARITNPKANTVEGFAQQIPVTNPFLKELMETFLSASGRNGNSRNGHIDFDELGVSEVVALLDVANMEAVVRDFGDRNPEEDPVIHFYEGFARDYDPIDKAKRGEFYTPRPVVSFIVRSVDEVLRTEFGLEDGLADTITWSEIVKLHKGLKIPAGISPERDFVQILDPATGTGTFLVEVIDLIHATMVEKWRAQGHGEKKIVSLWNEYVPQHLLTRLHAYELKMAPYTIAHLKVGLKLYETGYRFGSDERARVYLTNALEPPNDKQITLDFLPALAHEAQAVNSVKRQRQFTVVIGNPPYSRASANRGEFIEQLLERYKEPVRSERNIQPLSDDYIKFIRFSEHLIQTAGAGVHGMITNGTFLSGRIARGMRGALMQTFSTMRILDLHGSGKTKVLGDRQVGDENVFDILQGVAVSVFATQGTVAEIRYAELVGPRQSKYDALNHDRAPQSVKLEPVAPYYFLIPRTDEFADEYSEFCSVTDLFAFHSVSGKPGDDALLVSFSEGEVLPKLQDFRRTLRKQPNRAITEAARKLAARAASARFSSSAVTPYEYRPFDTRFTYYDPGIWTRAVFALAGRLNGSKILLTTKIVKDPSFAHAFVTRTLPDVIFLSNTSSVNCYSFPSCMKPAEGDLQFEGAVSSGNMKLRELCSSLGATVTTDEAFSYIYALLYSPIYRQRYYEFFQHDFPKIPLTTNRVLFDALVVHGRLLEALHLMESPKLDKPSTIIVGSDGPFQVEKVSYSNSTVWIDKSKTRGFRGVPEEVWEFCVGSYQVCEKWLKDRQAKGGKNPRPGRVLTDEDQAHYQKIIVSLAETIRTMTEIDEAIEAHGGWPDAFLGTQQSESLPKVAEPGPEYRKRSR